jgi:hypothetical protein
VILKDSVELVSYRYTVYTEIICSVTVQKIYILGGCSLEDIRLKLRLRNNRNCHPLTFPLGWVV